MKNFPGGFHLELQFGMTCKRLWVVSYGQLAVGDAGVGVMMLLRKSQYLFLLYRAAW